MRSLLAHRLKVATLYRQRIIQVINSNVQHLHTGTLFHTWCEVRTTLAAGFLNEGHGRLVIAGCSEQLLWKEGRHITRMACE